MQLGEPKPSEELPAFAERCVPWQTTHLVSAFQQAKVGGGAKPIVTYEYDGRAASLALAGRKAGARLTLPFNVARVAVTPCACMAKPRRIMACVIWNWTAKLH